MINPYFNLLQSLKRMNRVNPTLLCRKCGSTELTTIVNPSSGFDVWESYTCKCGHVSEEYYRVAEKSVEKNEQETKLNLN